jgi:hypothetical protein
VRASRTLNQTAPRHLAVGSLAPPRGGRATRWWTSRPASQYSRWAKTASSASCANTTLSDRSPNGGPGWSSLDDSGERVRSLDQRRVTAQTASERTKVVAVGCETDYPPPGPLQRGHRPCTRAAAQGSGGAAGTGADRRRPAGWLAHISPVSYFATARRAADELAG